MARNKNGSSKKRKKRKAIRDWCALPNELLIEIFKNYSLEELTRVKCVCKSFQRFLNSEDFIISKSTQGPSSPGWLLLKRMHPDCMSYVQKQGYRTMTLMATTYGIMCFLSQSSEVYSTKSSVDSRLPLEKLVIYNPLTQAFRVLPQPTQRGTIISVGLHYKRSSSTYEVIAVILAMNTELFHVAVYESSSKKWALQCSHETDYQVIKTSPMVWWNGSFFWTAGDRHSQEVLRFNAHNKRFERAQRYDGHFSNIHLWNDQLHLADKELYIDKKLQDLRCVRDPYYEAEAIVTHFVEALIDEETQHVKFNFVKSGHSCYVPNRDKELFKRVYYSPPRYCYKDYGEDTFLFAYDPAYTIV